MCGVHNFSTNYSPRNKANIPMIDTISAKELEPRLDMLELVAMHAFLYLERTCLNSSSVLQSSMADDIYKERKRKKKNKKHTKKVKKAKTANYESDSDGYSSENERQWIERKDLVKAQPPSLKHEDWMTVPVPPSSRSLDELTRRKELEEDKHNTTEVYMQ